MPEQPLPPFPISPLRSETKVRELGFVAVGLEPQQDQSGRPAGSEQAEGAASGQLAPPAVTETPAPTDAPLPSNIGDDDPYLRRVVQLLADGYAGVILTGPPGTSKSYYAEQIAAKLADRDPYRVRFIQFHASYQYEDFVEGYVPRRDATGFELLPKHLLEMAARAADDVDGKTYVLVIDELSRCDPARVFGEVLTYVERSRRGKRFALASGTIGSIPENLVFLATMNPEDRGVDEVDAALERRFAKIAMDPDREFLRQILTNNGVETGLKERITQFFVRLENRGRSTPACRIGHAYFTSIRDEDSLRRLWDNQLRFYFQKALVLDRDNYRAIEDDFNRTFPAPTPPTGGGGSPGVDDEPEAGESSTVGNDEGADRTAIIPPPGDAA